MSTPFGQSIRSYISGGIVASPITFAGIDTKENLAVTETLIGQPQATTASPLTKEKFLSKINTIQKFILRSLKNTKDNYYAGEGSEANTYVIRQLSRKRVNQTDDQPQGVDVVKIKIINGGGAVEIYIHPDRDDVRKGIISEIDYFMPGIIYSRLFFEAKDVIRINYDDNKNWTERIVSRQARVDEYALKFEEIIELIYRTSQTEAKEIDDAMAAIWKRYNTVLLTKDMKKFESLLAYTQDRLRPFTERGATYATIIGDALIKLRHLSIDYHRSSAGSPLEEINKRMGELEHDITERRSRITQIQDDISVNEKKIVNIRVQISNAANFQLSEFGKDKRELEEQNKRNYEAISRIRKHIREMSSELQELREKAAKAVASPLEILTEKFKAKGFSYGSLNAYVKLKEYLKELDAGQPIELDGIVYDSKSIEIINTIDDANNRYAQISVFSEDKSVPYHRIIIRGYQKSGSVFTYLDMGQDYERQDNEKKLPKDMEDLKERLEGAAFNDYDNFADVIMTAINKAVSKPTKKASGSLPAKGVSSSLQLKRGGIDLTDRMLKIKLERVGSFTSSALVLPEINNVEAFDLDKEFEQIQAMVSSSIRPSDTRILEFAAACYYKGEFDQRLEQVSSCVKAAHLADERLGKDSSDTLRLATMLPDALYGG